MRLGGDSETYPTMGTSIERLRALQHTAHGMDLLVENNDKYGPFTGADKVLMESFKKIFHLGVKQLNRFFNDFGKLNLAALIPAHDQLYYKAQLLNSPFSGYVAAKIIANEPFWRKKTDIMGITGDINNRPSSATPIYSSWIPKNDISVVTQTKLPSHMSYNLRVLDILTSTSMMYAIYPSVYYDDSLPNTSKGFNEPYKLRGDGKRVETEINGKLHLKAHGYRMVTDTPRYKITTDVEDIILGSKNEPPKPKDYSTNDGSPSIKKGKPPENSSQRTPIEDSKKYTKAEGSPETASIPEGGGNIRKFFDSEDVGKQINPIKSGVNDWEVYRFLKFYNPFTSQNKGTSWRSKVKRKVEYQDISYNDNNAEIITDKNVHVITDLTGKVYDGDDQKSAEFSVEYKPINTNDIKTASFKLYTVKGQLGHKPNNG